MAPIDFIAITILVILVVLYFTYKPKVKTETELNDINNQGNEISDPELLVSFFIPLVGFIIYGVNSSTKPYKAKKALSAALWGCGMVVIVSFLFMAVITGRL
jgi:Na+/H+ antiporter NhaD/arsenite permease-like protein